jgi:hypothetical protein
MDDLIVIVPGITGSALRDASGAIWDLSPAAISTGLANTGRTLAALRLPIDLGDHAPEHPLTPAGLVMGWHVWPGFWAGAGYGRLLHRLRTAYPDPGQVIAFPYDWRLSNRLTATRLNQVVDAALIRWRQHPGRRRAQVTYICHSMGGLIARYHLEVLGGRDTCRQMITLGTPFSGSIKAIRALTGELAFNLGRLGERLAEVAATFPSVHQLLPTYHCVQTAGNTARLTEVAVPGVSTAAIADAHRFAAEVTDALRRNGPTPYELHMFGGRSQPTDQSIRIGPGGIGYQRSQRGTNHTGDGTVPLFSSVAPEAGTTRAGIFQAVRHSGLQRHQRLLDQVVIDKVGGISLGEALAPQPELSLDLPDTATEGAEITLHVAAQVPDLLLQAQIKHAHDGVAYGAPLPVRPNRAGAYSATVQLPSGVWLVEVTTIAALPAGAISDLIVVA